MKVFPQPCNPNDNQTKSNQEGLFRSEYNLQTFKETFLVFHRAVYAALLGGQSRMIR
jgi:hypothetical protein